MKKQAEKPSSRSHRRSPNQHKVEQTFEPIAQQPALSLRPTSDDRNAWQAYWKAQGKLWRTEPEIDAERQAYLTERRGIIPDIKQGIYPFKDVKLSRPDIEWLLATHQDGLGPVDWSDEKQQTRHGLDLRGANLRGLNLSSLPLARIQGGLTWDEWKETNPEQCKMAGLHLESANLREAHLEGAFLARAHLEGTDLYRAYLKKAVLSAAHLEGVLLAESNLEEADLHSAYLEGASLESASMNEAFLAHVHLEGANLSLASLEHAYLDGAYLAGAILEETHLERAILYKAHLEDEFLPDEALKRVRKWMEDFPGDLPPANIRGAYLDRTTDLRGATFGKRTSIIISLADVHWGDVNLSVINIDWTTVKMLGDEYQARQKKTSTGELKDASTRLDEYKAAVRANRQLAVVLRDQGMNEEADHFAYRAQVLQRVVWRRRRRLLKYVLSWLLHLLAGYGYKPIRSLSAYLVIIFGFAIAYYAFGHIPPLEAFVFSLTSFHGRGFFPGNNISLSDPRVMLAAFEAVVGLLIEISFIATFTQRFFGK